MMSDHFQYQLSRCVNETQAAIVLLSFVRTVTEQNLSDITKTLGALEHATAALHALREKGGAK